MTWADPAPEQAGITAAHTDTHDQPGVPFTGQDDTRSCRCVSYGSSHPTSRGRRKLRQDLVAPAISPSHIPAAAQEAPRSFRGSFELPANRGGIRREDLQPPDELRGINIGLSRIGLTHKPTAIRSQAIRPYFPPGDDYVATCVLQLNSSR